MYKRVVLKLSGEALKGNGVYGIDPKTVNAIAGVIKEVRETGVDVCIVVGAGNLWRGKTGEDLGMDRSQADYMGMLGTVMNALALQDSLEQTGVPTRVLSALKIEQISEMYIRRRALRHLEKGRVIILAAGTGNPYFSTDTASALRAAELNAEVILMAKNGVDGVYDRDPNQHKDAKMYKALTYQEILEKKIEVMDQTAASLCKENNIDTIVFNMNDLTNIKKAVMQEPIGTLVRGK